MHKCGICNHLSWQHLLCILGTQCLGLGWEGLLKSLAFLLLAGMGNMRKMQDCTFCGFLHFIGLKLLFLHVSENQNEHEITMVFPQEFFFRLHLVLQ